ncbi:MAG TPA: hypothetical protein VF595_01825 [Tepidisphaeraceae bacterium]|jgi:endoglucanase
MSHVLHELTALPTAPFAETHVLAYVRAWARKQRFRVTADRAGNLLVERPTRRDAPRLVLVAHADHPGFVAETMEDKRTLRARFHGGVKASYFVGSRVRFFTKDNEIVGTVIEILADGDRPAGARLRVTQAVAPGAIGMWDVGGPRQRGRRFYCRVCDDLAGLAAGLEALSLASAERGGGPAAVLVTRGEEEGFIGAIAAVRARQLLRKTDRLISIECSAEQPYAKQGDGMIVRVGDRTSIFHSAFTRFIGERAEVLAKEDVTFIFQRALMPGGTCEATVFDAFGHIAAAVCVPLGNYHNMNAATGKIAAEYVDLRDWRSLVRLLADLCLHHDGFDGGHGALKERLKTRYAKFSRYL